MQRIEAWATTWVESRSKKPRLQRGFFRALTGNGLVPIVGNKVSYNLDAQASPTE